MIKTMYVGCAGASIPARFAGDFPGEGTHRERYSRIFNCMEINSSFHRPHKPATWEKWAHATPRDFRFAVKAPKTITHEAKLACAPADLQRFLQDAGRLGEKLGPILFQLPPKLNFDPSLARQFFAMLRGLHSGPVVCEPRHETWFRDDANDLLARVGVARVAADPARVVEAAHPGGSPDLLYYRWHGSPRTYYSSYSSDDLKRLSANIKRSAAKDDWCIFDNTASGAATGNALELKEILTD